MRVLWAVLQNMSFPKFYTSWDRQLLSFPCQSFRGVWCTAVFGSLGLNLRFSREKSPEIFRLVKCMRCGRLFRRTELDCRTCEEGSDFSADPVQKGHQHTGDAGPSEWPPVLQRLPAPACSVKNPSQFVNGMALSIHKSTGFHFAWA